MPADNEGSRQGVSLQPLVVCGAKNPLTIRNHIAGYLAFLYQPHSADGIDDV
jgi:hypothetical protein